MKGWGCLTETIASSSPVMMCHVSWLAMVSRHNVTHPLQLPVFHAIHDVSCFPPFSCLFVPVSSFPATTEYEKFQSCTTLYALINLEIQVCRASSVRHGVSGGRLVNAYSTNFCVISRSGEFIFWHKIVFSSLRDFLSLLYENTVNIPRLFVIKLLDWLAV